MVASEQEAPDARCEVVGAKQSRTVNKMAQDHDKKLGFTIEDGGQAHVRRTHAEVELERAIRALFYAMEGKKSRNLHNVAEGVTHPVRMLMKRLKEAKRARRDSVNYPLAKQTVQELDQYVDRLFNRTSENYTTGDHPAAA